ncbi:hypothetical protein FNV43_RR14723 [Rhamnella rubrinervis]|uniref:Uncharacterized protein n=1 Tax=Rhamnella rubrinervis TaxID=2594499 RepID=A0A8K0H3I3_9ROSA|nr:hypothetical protein FNV43_RR14723 [Rhamnella rubrinervis]
MMDMTDTAKTLRLNRRHRLPDAGTSFGCVATPINFVILNFCFSSLSPLLSSSASIGSDEVRDGVEGIEDDEKPKEPKDEKPKDDEQPKKGREFNILVLAQVVGDAITTAKDWVFGS